MIEFQLIDVHSILMHSQLNYNNGNKKLAVKMLKSFDIDIVLDNCVECLCVYVQNMTNELNGMKWINANTKVQ